MRLTIDLATIPGGVLQRELDVPTYDALPDRTRLRALDALPAVGDEVIIYAYGRFRYAVVIKRGPVRAQVAYSTVTSPDSVYKPFVRVDQPQWYAWPFVVDRSGPYAVKHERNKRAGHSLVDAKTREPVTRIGL